MQNVIDGKIKQIISFFNSFGTKSFSPNVIIRKIDNIKKDDTNVVAKADEPDLIILQSYLDGLRYRQKLRFDEAIKEYESSFNKFPQNTKYKALLHNAISACYREKKSYIDANIHLKEALHFLENADEKIKTLLMIFINTEFGNTYRFQRVRSSKDNLEEASKFYKNAISEIEKEENNRLTIPFPYQGLGYCQYYLGELSFMNYNIGDNKKKWDEAIEKWDEAIVNWRIAKSLFKKRNEKIKEVEIINSIELLERLKKQRKDIKNQHETSQGQILLKTIKIEYEMNQTKMELDDFLEIKKNHDTNDNKLYLKVLRQWNSYTPIMNHSHNNSKGGGYFLKINGYGIVIDPGFNYLENFINAGHKFNEIDAVFISHAHNDHTADFESILTMLHKYNENAKGIQYFDRILVNPEINPVTIYTDLISKAKINIKHIHNRDKIKNIIEVEFKNDKSFKKKIDFYITQSVFKKYSGFIDLYEKTNYNLEVIKPSEKYCVIKRKNKPLLKVKVIPAKHHDVISDNNSVGFCFVNNDSCLVYTGDTGFDENIEKIYERVHNTQKNKKIILLAHIGGFKQHEWNYDNSYSAYYSNHLGRLGLLKLCEVLQPQTCLISEFGEEFKNNGHRNKIPQIYQGILPEIKFLPADVGLVVNLNNTILSVIAVNPKDITYRKGFVDPENVTTKIVNRDNRSFIVYYKGDLDEYEIDQVFSNVNVSDENLNNSGNKGIFN